jgi:hypothetical protein
MHAIDNVLADARFWGFLFLFCRFFFILFATAYVCTAVGYLCAPTAEG